MLSILLVLVQNHLSQNMQASQDLLVQRRKKNFAQPDSNQQPASYLIVIIIPTQPDIQQNAQPLRLSAEGQSDTATATTTTTHFRSKTPSVLRLTSSQASNEQEDADFAAADHSGRECANSQSVVFVNGTSSLVKARGRRRRRRDSNRICSC